MGSRISRQAILVRFLYFVEGLRFTIDHPCGVTGLSNTPCGNKLPNPPDGGKPLAPRRGSLKEGWVSRFMRKARGHRFKTSA